MPVHYAIEQHDVELVQHILDLASTRTCSYQSAAGGHGDLIRTMLNARTGTGNTALHMAASLGSHVRIEDRCTLIRRLLKRGADPSAKNSERQLPQEMTRDPRVTIHLTRPIIQPLLPKFYNTVTQFAVVNLFARIIY